MTPGAAGDGLGAGVAQTLYAIDGAGFAPFSSSFTLVSEGTHTVSFYSVDYSATPKGRCHSAAIDLTAPTAALVSSGTLYAIPAQDPVVKGAASGVAQINYLIDVSPNNCPQNQPNPTAPPGTCANLAYAGPFSLAIGTHTVYIQALDNVGNGKERDLVELSSSSGDGGFGSFGIIR